MPFPYKALRASGLAVGAGAALTAYAIHGRSSQIFGPSIYRGKGRRRTIALTFDDGPNLGTLPLLRFLDRHGLQATFFQCGSNAARHPDIARAVYAAGHEIGNHTWSHPHLPPHIGWHPNFRSPASIFTELARTQELLTDLCDGNPPRLFRAPYGMRWYGLRRAQRQLGLLGVMWTVIGHDWEWPAEAVARHVLAGSSPGGVICLHDGRDIQPDPDLSSLVEALEAIVPVLQAQGYGFETVSGMLARDAAEISAGRSSG